MELQLDCRRLLNTDSKPVRTTAVCPPYKVSIAYPHDAARILVLISSTVYILRYAYSKASRWEGDRESSSIASVTSITRCISPLLHTNGEPARSAARSYRKTCGGYVSSPYPVVAITSTHHSYKRFKWDRECCVSVSVTISPLLHTYSKPEATTIRHKREACFTQVWDPCPVLVVATAYHFIERTKRDGERCVGTIACISPL